MMDREGLVLNCQTAVTMNDSRLSVHCSVLRLICKPNPSYTKIWGHVSMGLTRTKYRSYYTSLGNRVMKVAEGTTAMLHVFETDSITNKLQASTAFAQGKAPSVPTQQDCPKSRSCRQQSSIIRRFSQSLYANSGTVPSPPVHFTYLPFTVH